MPWILARAVFASMAGQAVAAPLWVVLVAMFVAGILSLLLVDLFGCDS